MNKNTVFVIGAGASKEANLPDGYELKSKIAGLLDMRFDDLGEKLSHGDHKIMSALNLHVQQPDGRRGDINPYLSEARNIRDALPLAISIDNFIDAHRDNEKIALCGKLAIVRSILDAERQSLLHFKRSRVDSNINYSSLEKTWYLSFFQLLTENCGKNDLKARFGPITLIIFNYDRCIEHFIYYALRNYYKLSEAEAAEIVKCIAIYHPYGAVGNLPWIDRKSSMEFGVEPNPNQLLELTQKIKTFTEGTDPNSSDISEIRSHMGYANRVVFLGFAFHKLNMQLINPGSGNRPEYSEARCFATTFDISNSDEEIIRGQIKNLYRSEIIVKMKKLSCCEFFKEFWRSLSF